MRGYGQYCPIALGAEVFAERWTPLILRNLSVGCTRFSELLEGAPGLPRSVLSQRLRRLERDGVVSRTGTGASCRYELTASGRELAEVGLVLGTWGARWREVRPEHEDPYLALWTVCRLVDPATLPRPRVVVRVDLTDAPRPPDRYWLRMTRVGNELCATPPGDDEDGVLTSTVSALVSWHRGVTTLGQQQRAGRVTLVAPRWVTTELNRWGRLSPFATVRPAS